MFRQNVETRIRTTPAPQTQTADLTASCRYIPFILTKRIFCGEGRGRTSVFDTVSPEPGQRATLALPHQKSRRNRAATAVRLSL